MNYNTNRFIEDGLAIRKPLCPACNKLIHSADQAGVFAYYISTSEDGQSQEMTPYLVCMSCVPALQRKSVIRQIERRLEKDRLKYIFPMKMRGMRSPHPMVISSGKSGPWKDDDRDWFEMNPSRSFRLRRTCSEEENMGSADWVIICQTEPGKRGRMPWRPSFSGPELEKIIKDLQDSDEALWRLFDEITDDQMHNVGGEA